jgi:hypothetical protein
MVKRLPVHFVVFNQPLYQRYLPLPCRREGIRKKAGRRYADIDNFAVGKRAAAGVRGLLTGV